MAISYSDWQAYPWKNELDTQTKRVATHYAELLGKDFEGAHIPMHMLERAIVLAAFSIRRMFEKRLVTDKLREEEITVRMFESNTSGDFRPPYKGRSGGEAFRSYNFKTAGTKRLTINDLANEIIHSSQFMFVSDEATIPNGLLIASDRHLKARLLHLSIDEFNSVAQRVLDDRVRIASDSWDPTTGAISATRE
jgi:hypothetical protein